MNNFTTAEFDWIRDNEKLIEKAVQSKNQGSIITLAQASVQAFDVNFTRRLFACLDYLEHPNSFIISRPANGGTPYLLENPEGLLNSLAPSYVFIKYFTYITPFIYKSGSEFKNLMCQGLYEDYPWFYTSGFNRTFVKIMALAKVEFLT